MVKTSASILKQLQEGKLRIVDTEVSVSENANRMADMATVAYFSAAAVAYNVLGYASLLAAPQALLYLTLFQIFLKKGSTIKEAMMSARRRVPDKAEEFDFADMD